ncbi:MAG: family 78 glycoside hydrolase catalytic domain [Propionibacteriaceae bacterium]|nr:family 78 glycoside hydrolase catalytic domain [Propionibacteriaceae bacterium]
MNNTDPVAALATAEPIGATPDTGPAPILSTRFRLDEGHGMPTRATLHATAHGIYEASLNGHRVSHALFTPGWTAYEWRLQVHSFDVTGLLADDNRLEFLLGNGWWRGNLGFASANANYGDRLALLAGLDVEYADGHVQQVTTGPDWTGATSRVLANSLYNGQTIDFGHATEPLPVEVVGFDRTPLVPAVGPSVQRQETLRPQQIWTAPSGATLVDFGQNLVGWLRFTVQGPRDTRIQLRHAEVLIDGELATEPLREAACTDVAILSGALDTFEPTLTFHGFRYAEVTGWPGELTADDIEAVVAHSQVRRTGWFDCSDARVNQLVHNAIWGQKGNFLEVPTDCPQRDERLGWTGDIAAFAPSASYAFDVADFLHKWLLDLAAETRAAKGIVPLVVPDVLKHGHLPDDLEVDFTGPFAIWGDAAVWVPQALWQAYGDPDRLAAHYPAMTMHLDGIEAKLSPTGLWDTGSQLGDWLDPDAPPENPGQAKADPGVIATACLYRSASFVAEAARALDRTADAERYQRLADHTRAAFNAHYVAPDGVITSDCATVYALAICFGLLDQDTETAAGQRLAQVVTEAGHRISTGFAGTPYVTWALSRTGHVEDAYRLLLQTECPSWLYSVSMGATTVWERWDSLRPDGTLNTGMMTSFNHYALGAVVDWLYQVVAGIQPAAPGYAAVRLAPTPGPGLTHASAALDTPHGRVACGWLRVANVVEVRVTVPDGGTATLVRPDGTEQAVPAGSHTFRWEPTPTAR